MLTSSRPQKKKHVSPTVKAVARLTSSKLVIRQATLAWLEQAGAQREPEYLTLTSHTELLDIVRALREWQETVHEVLRNAPEGKTGRSCLHAAPLEVALVELLATLCRATTCRTPLCVACACLQSPR